MANILTIDSGGVSQGVRINEREKIIRYNVALSGAYTQFTRLQNVGEVLNLGAVVGVFKEDQFWGQKGPVRGYVVNIGATGFSMSIIPGADNLHWLLAIFSGVSTQLGGGVTYASNGLSTDLDIFVEFSGRRFD
jgi:hypothetical protein